jgi:carboxyl-terminal processing protease
MTDFDPGKKRGMSRAIMPIVLAIVLASGLFLGSRLNVPFITQRSFLSPKTSNFNKFSDVLTYIQHEYVDTVDRDMLVDISIEKMLHSLDPHSAYIRTEELRAANEPLEGNFEGIGVEFHIQADTIMVVSPIAGGPSEAVGILSGDRIVMVEDTIVAGVGITNADVMQKLRGPGGTEVKVSVYRRNETELVDFVIKRGNIPIYSVDVAYMVNDSVGYIKISRFAATTYDEFIASAEQLENSGMKKLILDLRGNPGGYLDAATKVSDEFLPAKKMIVYTEGKSRPKTTYNATNEGSYESLPVVVMIDEGSASASEILAGAIQDWDRGTIIGRRSFGKGLVQEQTLLPDGSAIRLTIARYYTPTGRSIQKPYSDDIEEYFNELNDRFLNNELYSADSIHFPDSLQYRTPAGRIVYGGGGIMPDVFVPVDSTGRNNPFLVRIARGGLVSQFAYNYVDANRESLSKYENFESFNTEFRIEGKVYNEFLAFVNTQDLGVSNDKKDESRFILLNQLKAFIARQLFNNDGFYPILHLQDKGFQKALESFNITSST